MQVGDPFTEKLLLEACLELMATDCIVAIQDMGAAGLTCSLSKWRIRAVSASSLTSIPSRRRSHDIQELMLSESQERMLMVLKPGEETARQIFGKWELVRRGRITDPGFGR